MDTNSCNYEKIRKSYRLAKRNVLNKTKELKDLDTALSRISQSKSDMLAKYEQDYSIAKERSKEEHKQKLLAPLQTKLEEAQKNLEETQREYEESLGELTEEKLLEQYSSQQDILLEVRESTVELQAQLKETVGEQFYSVLYQQLEEKQVQLEESDLDSVIEYFNECSAKLDKVLHSRSPLTRLVNAFEEKVLNSKLVVDSSSVLLGVGALYLVASFFLYKYVFPVYGVLLLFQSVYNVFHFYDIYKILVVQKSVQDNILLIDEKIHQDVIEDLERRKAENEEVFQKRLADCQGIIDKVNNEMLSVSVTVSNTFSFDDSSIKQTYAANMKSKEEHESNLLESKYRLNKELNLLQEEVARSREQLLTILKESTSFDKPGKDYVFDPTFVLDVDEKELRIVSFDFPQTSALFLFNSYDEVYDYLRLINLQLRCKLNPFAFNVLLYDDVMMGMPCLKFSSPSKKKGDTSVNLFKIVTTEEDLKGIVQESMDALQSRINTIRREFKDIFSYNDYMIEIESVPESYEFWFVLEPSSTVASSPQFQKVLVNGGELGIFCHVFRKQDNFYNDKSGARSLLTSVDRVYLLQNGVLNKVAKEKIEETLEKK